MNTKINASSRLRNMSVFRVCATSLAHVSISSEVQHTLLKWVANVVPEHRGVLVGGLALSFYCKPRYTQDVDILFLYDSDVPTDVDGFKVHRKLAFEETKYQVEVEIVTPSSVGLPLDVARQVIKTSVVHSGMRVPSLEGMIVLKLYGSLTPKRYLKDLADVAAMLEHRPLPDLSEWHLNAELKANLHFAINSSK